MSDTITADDGSGATTPDEMLGFDITVDSANVVHDLIDGTRALTLVGDRPRSGAFTALYRAEADAHAARLLLGGKTTFSLVSDVAEYTMTFGRAGQMTPVQHDTVRSAWVFTVGFQELP